VAARPCPIEAKLVPAVQAPTGRRRHGEDEQAADAVELILAEGAAAAMNQFNA